ncbi:hypothetical protein ACS0TY_009727 [Phlomoides rotata]
MDKCLFGVMLWRLWKEQNAMVWKENCSNASYVGHLACCYLEEYVKVHNSVFGKNVVAKCKLWHAPPKGEVKDSLQMGINMVLRDDNGEFIACKSLVIPGVYAVGLGEAIGVYEALSWIKGLGMERVVVEMDAKLVFEGMG